MKTHTEKWIGLCLHHSAGSQKDTVESLKNYHINTRGYGDIGYHYFAEIKNGHAYLKSGRPTKYNGAHAGVDYHNANYIGYCIAGNYETTKMEDSIYNDMIGHLCTIIKKFNLTKLCGHKECDPKNHPTACPGKNINLNKVREDVNKALERSGSNIRVSK